MSVSFHTHFLRNMLGLNSKISILLKKWNSVESTKRIRYHLHCSYYCSYFPWSRKIFLIIFTKETYELSDIFFCSDFHFHYYQYRSRFRNRRGWQYKPNGYIDVCNGCCVGNNYRMLVTGSTILVINILFRLS